MSTQEDIDKLFRQAQEKIISDDQQVRSELWPQIKDAIKENTDLTMEERRRLMLLIAGHLDKQRLLQPREKPQQPLSIRDLLNRPRSSEQGPKWHLW